jgi:hypothetical protein
MRYALQTPLPCERSVIVIWNPRAHSPQEAQCRGTACPSRPRPTPSILSLPLCFSCGYSAIHFFSRAISDATSAQKRCFCVALGRKSPQCHRAQTRFPSSRRHPSRLRARALAAYFSFLPRCDVYFFRILWNFFWCQKWKHQVPGTVLLELSNYTVGFIPSSEVQFTERVY